MLLDMLQVKKKRRKKRTLRWQVSEIESQASNCWACAYILTNFYLGACYIRVSSRSHFAENRSEGACVEGTYYALCGIILVHAAYMAVQRVRGFTVTIDLLTIIKTAFYKTCTVTMKPSCTHAITLNRRLPRLFSYRIHYDFITTCPSHLSCALDILVWVRGNKVCE